MRNQRVALLRLVRLKTALWVVLAVLLNHLAAALPLRVDLTSDQRHTLSLVARDSVAGLERPLLAQVVFSEGLAAPYHDHRSALLDLLGGLSAASGGRMQVSAVDPTGDPGLVAQAAAAGVRPIPYAFRDWDRTESRTVFLGVTFHYGERAVTVDALPSIPRMEGEVVGAIRRLTQPAGAAPTIGWLLGHGEPDPTAAGVGTPLAALHTRLAARGAFRTVTPGDGLIPDDLDVLVVVAPRLPLSAEALLALDAFLVRGGALMLWVSSVQPDFQAGVPAAVDHGLTEWLAQRGVVLSADPVLDRDHTERMAVVAEVEGLGRRWVQVNYPLALVTTGLDRTVRAVRDLPRAVLPFVTPVALADPLPNGVDGAVWVETMGASRRVPGLATLDPRALRQVGDNEHPGPHPVVVGLQGPLGRPGVGQRSVLSRMVVVGSGDAIANNLDLASNALDWLVGDPALIAVRSRSRARPPLLPPSRADAVRAKLLVVGTPLLLLLVGAGLARRRRG